MLRIDDFLIDRVFQPLVLALGIEVNRLCQICVFAIIALIFAEISLAWTGLGEVKWMSIILIVILTPRLVSTSKESRASSQSRFWRLVMVGLSAGGLAHLLSCAMEELPLSWFDTLNDLDSVPWVAWLYIAVCRDPPPQGRFAWSAP